MRWRKAETQNRYEWHDWFAWFPVQLNDTGETAWLETVRRRCVSSWDDYWTYKSPVAPKG